jgi:hypothetical protein
MAALALLLVVCDVHAECQTVSVMPRGEALVLTNLADPRCLPPAIPPASAPAGATPAGSQAGTIVPDARAGGVMASDPAPEMPAAAADSAIDGGRDDAAIAADAASPDIESAQWDPALVGSGDVPEAEAGGASTDVLDLQAATAEVIDAMLTLDADAASVPDAPETPLDAPSPEDADEMVRQLFPGS